MHFDAAEVKRGVGLCLGVVCAHRKPRLLQERDDGQRRRIPDIVGIGLEGETEYGDARTARPLAQFGKDPASEAVFAGFVFRDERLDQRLARAVLAASRHEGPRVLWKA